MKEEAKALKKDMADLEVLHRDSASLEHAIRKYDNQWHEFLPSRFIYSFFTFNTLYSIDWEKSLRAGKLVSYDDTDEKPSSNTSKEWLGEKDMYNRYLDFCFSDREFVNVYEEFFFDFIGQTFDKRDILRELGNIHVDEKSSGAIKKKYFIRNFYDACARTLNSKTLDIDDCRTILTFIYKIRCNIFHGTKTLKELHNKSQQKRIDIYTVFLIAINQMVFSYIDYLNGIDITYEFDFLRKTLNDKNYD